VAAVMEAVPEAAAVTETGHSEAATAAHHHPAAAATTAEAAAAKATARVGGIDAERESAESRSNRECQRRDLPVHG
jgi:hypothetical protein